MFAFYLFIFSLFGSVYASTPNFPPPSFTSQDLLASFRGMDLAPSFFLKQRYSPSLLLTPPASQTSAQNPLFAQVRVRPYGISKNTLGKASASKFLTDYLSSMTKKTLEERKEAWARNKKKWSVLDKPWEQFPGSPSLTSNNTFKNGAPGYPHDFCGPYS